jgi:ABC-type transport system involved in multi-copper enzyme maturation permease subunit
MIWLTWRQFRAQGFTVLALLVAAAIGFLITGLGMHHSYAADLAACIPRNACDSTFRDFQESYAAIFNLLELLVIATPALIGIFWGAPLIGRELETGTHQVVWNQTITRSRWLAVKLTGVGIASVATAGILGYLLTWWAGPLDQINGDRFGAMTFSTRDIVPLGYAAFAFALGSLTGLLLRRTVPAMALTLAVFIGVQILVPTLIRPNLLPSTTVTFAIDRSTTSQSHGIFGRETNFHFDLPLPQGAWLISDSPVETSAGQVARFSDYPECFPGVGGSGKPDFGDVGDCLAKYDLHETVSYQPVSHYWPLQWMETGMYLLLAGTLTGTCFWWIRRRHN